MQIATWNINSLNVRLPQVLDWLADNPVDVLALQELKLTDDKFPAEALARTPPPRRVGASGGGGESNIPLTECLTAATLWA